MKARIRKTGEIVNISDLARITIEYCDSKGYPIKVKPEDIELIQEQTEDEHWQDVRERAAIAAMQGALANCYLHNVSYHTSHISLAEQSVLYADALIEQLKKK